MKKSILTTLFVAVTLVMACKKEDDIKPIDITGKTYSAETKFNGLPTYLQLNFQSNGTVTLLAFPELNTINTLKYDITDRMAENTTLHIYGELSKGLYADGLTTGTKIDWNSNIGRLRYNTNIVGFTADKYNFTAK